MLKNNKNIFLILLLALIIPLSFVLVGCGATPSHQAQGVSFISDVQDEEGNAVFELDLNSKVKLPYKINPSSAFGYAPRFTAVKGIDGDNIQTFDLNITTGEFCITNTEFDDVKVRIDVGDYSDECWIKLKTYPTAIGIYDETQFNSINSSPKISMATGSVYQINIAAIFEDSEIVDSETNEQKPTLLSDTDYNFLVEAYDNSKTLINVPSSSRLNIMAYNNYGTAKVKVSICDYNKEIYVDENDNPLSFDIEINVYVICDSIEVNLDGANRIVSSKSTNNTLTISADDLIFDNATNIYTMRISADFYDRFNRLISDNNLRIKCFVNDTSYVSVSADSSKLFISKPQYNNSLGFKLEIWSNAALSTGEFCVIDIIINISF